VITAADGEDALEQYRAGYTDIDVVLLDLGMPGMGGEKCLAELRKINEEAKIVIASGYLNHRFAQNPQKYGAAKFMNKPYKVSEMVQEIKAVLGGVA
jgi:DNA-binding NarL/FixJ family response regulator